MTEKLWCVPVVYIQHDEEEFRIVVELAGVNKEDINLEMTDSGFCLSAQRRDCNYSGCFSLAHEIDPDQAKAQYENGLLKITVPITKKVSGKQIKID